MWTTIRSEAIIYIDQGLCCRGQYNGQVVSCCPSTTSEVFLVFTTQLHSNHPLIMLYYTCINNRDVLQPESSPPPIVTSNSRG